MTHIDDDRLVIMTPSPNPTVSPLTENHDMKITDTTKKSAAERLFEASYERYPGAAIEAEERRGGEEMLGASVLPVKGSDDPDVLALGIEWGEVDPADPLFRLAELPSGWIREAGDNPYGYWTHIVDEHGEQRASIFYKAAFYDRRAHIMAVRQCSCGHSANSHRWVDDKAWPCNKCGCNGDFLR